MIHLLNPSRKKGRKISFAIEIFDRLPNGLLSRRRNGVPDKSEGSICIFRIRDALEARQNMLMNQGWIEMLDDLNLGCIDRAGLLTQYITPYAVLRVGKSLEHGKVEIGIRERIIADPIENTEKTLWDCSEDAPDNLPRPMRGHQGTGNSPVRVIIADMRTSGCKGLETGGKAIRTVSGQDGQGRKDGLPPEGGCAEGE
ncbi:hypothetical protein KHP60_16000 [Microvirga sp. 3-52]|uniref:hypothetical protein n=1 Tax=Microvirga sp. 3-52 TaxID=2792425 RepID=UPI001AD0975C|nr:hypothetical protein [Microvirga sp. 3-52]MBO1906569.1 hypothetical protein [Microvirga sp. 3-52]MBS7453834.1 hypothetical protein [Microvirga sp. 3-52]